ncbi:hypothetical protein HF888_10550 [Bermanella marisrubri]|uniref:Uncharacterized protein n=1 Tax=Bermanella marisrubri TaxID=207949 RepID=Q1N5S4_9GAMM|nr:hypothetical protein [Bermanella marisrubri]EAT13868.1 hypothetical protein RED65_10759 [Oceanobacter sp. RED65] [Bermanella marisrubri]QIZ84628.1 hypothetical protein HF888_10550 [Bermanella marisrubri]
MQIYIFVACDRLEEAQEKQLKQNREDILAALKAYTESMPQVDIKVINETDSDNCEDWVLGIEQPIKKPKQLQTPVNLFNDLAKQYGIDAEFGTAEDGNREAVSYFGHEEGKGDSFMLAQYLEL